MSNLGNKAIMAKNIKRLVEQRGIAIKDLADAIGVPYTTAYNWTQAAAYPRIDKIERMARYFGVSKTDLVEDLDEMRDDLITRALQDRPDLLSLYHVAKNATPVQVEQAIRIIKALQEG